MHRGDSRLCHIGLSTAGDKAFTQSRNLSGQFSHEQDVPLDAFGMGWQRSLQPRYTLTVPDKQLLSELSSHSQQQQSQDHGHSLLPPRQQDSTSWSRDDHRPSVRRPPHSLHQTLMPLASRSGRESEHPPIPTMMAVQNHGRHEQLTQINLQETYGGYGQARNEISTNEPRGSNSSRLTLNRTTPIVRGIQLIPVSDIPDKLGSIFPHKLLNAVQSKCFPVAFHTDDNLVLSAPTGCGKTLVMELAICRLLAHSRSEDFKVIYQAPTKALCFERYRDWKAKFGTLGLQCSELTGDTEWNHLRQVQEARIIITTPEKWDSVTRKWRDQIKLIRLIKLFLVDEIHTLREPRGATLEAVVSRMKSIGTDLRFIALSATVPNSEDIATWLGRSTTQPDLPAHREVFDETFRPTKLSRHVYGFEVKSNEFGCEKVFMKQLANDGAYFIPILTLPRLPDVIARHSQGKPTMIFCMTRKSASTTALSLATLFNKTADLLRLWPKPRRPVNVANSDLKQIVATGVAFHHAGLATEDRVAIEQGFLDANISIICSTSTLAVGINLPCYLVILQGTTTYGAAGIQEYSDLEIMQMLGRAGRPQFETSACAVILTRKANVEKYQKMMSGQELIESTLHRNLIEHLNAEIALGTVYDIESAKIWLASTFLFVRLGRNPSHYHLSAESPSSNRKELLQQICSKDIDLLIKHACVESDHRLKCTEIGDAMARYCVRFETMRIFMSIPPKAKLSEILSVLSQAVEFNEVRFKLNEKAYYKKLNEAVGIRYPIKVDIALTAHKVSILVQAELGGVDQPVEVQFKKLYGQHGIDKGLVFNHARRLMRCIVDCQLHMKDAISVQNALELGRSIAAGAWDNTPQQLREIPGIGNAYARKLAAAGINSLDGFINTEPERIDLVLGKSQPFGRNLLKKMSDLPDLRIAVKELSRVIKCGQGILLNMKAEVGFLNGCCPSFFKGKPVTVIFVVEDAHGELYDFRRSQAGKFRNGDEIFFTILLTKPSLHIRCSVMCDEIVGTLRYAECAIMDVPTTAFAKPTGLTKIGHSSFDQKLDVLSVDDIYGDDGLDDSDLLAMGTDESGVEFVKHIDDCLIEPPEVTGKLSEEAIECATEGHKIDSHQMKVSSQLDNGRWTCQHTCRDRGVGCKHKCCVEGVAKPRGVVNAQAKADGPEKSQQNRATTVNLDRRIAFDLDNIDTDAPRDSIAEFARAYSPRRTKQTPAKRRQRHSSRRERERESKKLRLKQPLSAGVDNCQGTQPSRPISTPFDLDEEHELLTADDWDWINVKSAIDQNENIVKLAGGESKMGALHYIDEPENEHGQPVPFLSLADLERPAGKSLFIKGVSSCPGKDVGSVGQTEQQQHEDEETGVLREDFPGFTREPWPLSAEENSEFSLTTATKEMCQRSLTHGKVADGLFVECFSEWREGRLREEEQRKKWEGIDPWLYEQYHDLVELRE